MIKKVFTFLWQKHDHFWFSSRALLNLAVMRILLAGSLFGLYLSRQWDLNNFYTDAGILPKSLALQIYPEFFRPALMLSFWPDQSISFVHGILVIGLLLLTFGIGNRFVTFLLWILSISFMQRNFSIAFGADLIGNIFLLLLAGTQSCERLSVLNLIKKNKVISQKSDLLTNVVFRLIQIQLAILYMYTGMEKLKGSSWWDGTALWTVLANPQMVIFDMTWTRYLPFVLVAGTFTTLLFEIYFPFLMATFLRIPGLIFGIFFHLSIGFLMALWGFAVIMISPYVLFISEEELLRLLERMPLKKLSQFKT